MYKSDEKQAFEDMLAEISDSDDESIGIGSKNAISNKPSVQNNKYTSNSSNKSSYLSTLADSKSTSSNVQSYNNTFKQQTSLSKQERDIENFGAESTDQYKRSDSIDITKRWLLRPCSINERETMKCYIVREKSSFSGSTYRCYLETNYNPSDPNYTFGSGGRFLMSAKKKVVNKTSYYLISLDSDATDDRGKDTVLGKVMRRMNIIIKYIHLIHYYMHIFYILLYSSIKFSPNVSYI